MKIFSDDPKPVKRWSMRADKWYITLRNMILSAVAAFIISLALPEGELAQAVFGIMFVVLAIGADLRERLVEIFHQNRNDLP